MVEPDGQELFRAAPRAATQLGGTLDATFVRIAGEVPGFGGFYLDADGELNVVMAGAERAQATPSQVAAALRPYAQELRLDPAVLATVRFRAGTYNFLQLDAMHRGVAPVLGLAGTVFTDADEVRNRVVVGVEDDAAALAVRKHVAMLGLPDDAVIVERAAPLVPEQSLRERVRPVAGGLQINFTRGDPPSGFNCTLGFNVRAPNRPDVEGFVTNSHCSDTRGEVVPTPYWQHSRFTENTFIGWEAHDAPYWQGGICPEGRRCRYSDALGVRYESGVENAFGAIYRTLFPGDPAGSLDIDPANPRWQIVDEVAVPIVGQVLHKTGRTNGWTTGPVSATCQNSNVSGGDFTMLCQDRVATTSAGGDSGSPYYERVGETNQVRLVGIHWGSGGGTTVMSAMNNIRCENEGAVPWITYPGQTPPATPTCTR